jgi:hypothetical protein
LATFCPCPATLCGAEFKDDGLINLMEEISSQHSVQDVTWILVGAFSKIYCMNCEQNADHKSLKLLSFTRKGALLKLGPRMLWLLKRLASLKRNKILCIGTIGMKPRGHPRNWLGPIQPRLKSIIV